MSAWAAVIRRLDWGWKSHLLSGSCPWLLVGGLSFQPHGPLLKLLERPHGMATGFLQSEERERKAGTAMPFTASSQKSQLSFPISLLVKGQSYSVWEDVNTMEQGSLGAILENAF